MKLFGKNSIRLGILTYLLFINLFFIGLPAQNTLVNGLKVGDKINYLDILNKEGKLYNLSNLDKDKISILFIMSQPCHVCQKNKAIWQRIFVLTKKRISTYCILLGDISKLIEFSETSLFRFPLYCPKNIEKFKESFRLKSRKAQTLLLENNQVIYSKIGIMDVEDYKQIIKLTKGE